MTTAEQWERLARDANAAAVKAMAEADRLRAELAEKALEAETYHGMSVRLNDQLAALRAAGGQALNIVFDGPPGPVSGRFIEVENDAGAGVNAGEWSERSNGWWALRIPAAGGQEKPTDAGYARAVAVVDAIPMDPEDDPSQNEYEQAMAVGFNIALAKVHRELSAAAPVGGQAEPSDAPGEQP